MRQFVRSLALFGMLLCAAASAFASTPSDFYVNLLRRGIVAFDAEKYGEASEHLKIAAFGFVDSIEHYETAQIYLALAYDRQDNTEKARDAARRVVAAERVERKFAALKIPARVATSFDAVARKLLTTSEVAFLGRAPQNLPPPNTTPPPAAAPVVAQGNGPKQPATTTATPTTTTTTVKETGGLKPAAPQETEKKPPVIAPKPAPPAPKPQPVATTPAPDIPSRLAAAERALIASDLPEARRVYRELLETAGIPRDTLIRVAEGLYRSRDFEGALAAFAKLGALRRGEEPYHYYVAVAYYETGRYQDAKKALAAALPHIEITPDVAKYRAKIDGALD